MTSEISDATTAAAERESRRIRAESSRRNPAPWILAGVVFILGAYYAVVSFSGVLSPTTTQTLNSAGGDLGDNYITLRMQVNDIDLSNRTVKASVLPIPRGNLAGNKAGEIAQSLRIEVSSGGVTSTVVAYPGESIIDPTGVDLTLDRGDTAYPFDRPFARYQLSVTNDESGDPVPFNVAVENSSRPWVIQATADPPVSQGATVVHPITLDGKRDGLSIAVVGFYVLAIVLTTLMAVVTIGSALVHKTLDFSNVIWLSATMISFPALRSAMPGAPPIGTSMDFIVVFPCMALVAIMLVWTGGYLLWRESSVLRRRVLTDGEPSNNQDLGTLLDE